MRDFILRLLKAILDWLAGIFGGAGGRGGALRKLSEFPRSAARTETQNGQTVFVEEIQYTNPQGQLFQLTVKGLQSSRIDAYINQARVWFYAEPNPVDFPTSTAPDASQLFMEGLARRLEMPLEEMTAASVASRLRRDANNEFVRSLVEDCEQRANVLRQENIIDNDQFREMVGQLPVIGASLLDVSNAGQADSLDIEFFWNDPARTNTPYRVDFLIDPPINGERHKYKLREAATSARAKVTATDRTVTGQLRNEVIAVDTKTASTLPDGQKIVTLRGKMLNEKKIIFETNITGRGAYDIGGSVWVRQ